MPTSPPACPPRLDPPAASPATRRSPTHPATWPAPTRRTGGRPAECQGFGGVLEPRYISGAGPLVQWNITHPFKDGWFLDNLLVVSALPHSFSFCTSLGAL